MIRKIIADGTAEREFLNEVEKRQGETDKKISETVSEIIENVRIGGDKAVQDYTLKFDGKLPEYYEVPKSVIEDAVKNTDPEFKASLERAAENIREFHIRQKEQGFIDPHDDGVILGQRVRGLARVGLYVPGGTAAYPSSVLMNAIPAKIAGVGEVIMVTPP
ncbi:MAG: histidinol dehydrogenase, partial [Oscillospiraceae bacterium]|nr:histidinol dehydrogenase [Oscillospiraceae bacterium]